MKFSIIFLFLAITCLGENVVRRSDGKILYSVNVPDYPESDYIIEPPALGEIKSRGIPDWHIKISGEDVEEMKEDEKIDVDVQFTVIADKSD
jgi:hypothetical protein